MSKEPMTTTLHEFFDAYGLTPKKPALRVLMGWSARRLALFVEAYIELASKRELTFRASPGARARCPGAERQHCTGDQLCRSPIAGC
jgi:hypothetical protein